jgi:hypothetical protein
LAVRIIIAKAMVEAKRTMQRVALYQTPWDVENAGKHLMLLGEITAASV